MLALEGQMVGDGEVPPEYALLAARLLHNHLQATFPSVRHYRQPPTDMPYDDATEPPPVHDQTRITAYLQRAPSFAPEHWDSSTAETVDLLAAFGSVTWKQAWYIYHTFGYRIGNLQDWRCDTCASEWDLYFTGPCPHCPVPYTPHHDRAGAWVHLRRHARVVGRCAAALRCLYDEVYYKPGGRGYTRARCDFEAARRGDGGL